VELADALGREHPPYAGVPHIVSLAPTYLIHFPKWFFAVLLALDIAARCHSRRIVENFLQ